MGTHLTKINEPYQLPIIASLLLIFATSLIIYLKNNRKSIIINKNNISSSNNNTSINNSSNKDNNNQDNDNSISSISEFDDYDIIIDIPSVDSFVIQDASWTVFVCKSLHETHLKNSMNKNDNLNSNYPLDELLEGSHKFKTACVVGYFNRGKTFLINLIKECNLPSGRKTKTKGLSIIISQNNSTLFIDTQGCNTPLPSCNIDNNETDKVLKEIYNIKQNDTSMVELNNLHLARKKATESFHQEVAIGLSNVVMLVVNEMTWSDQQNIMALQRKIMNQVDNNKDSKDHNIIKSRVLYVIHNYMSVGSIQDLMAMVKDYVTTPFKGEFQSYYNKETSIFYYVDAKNITTHYFLCNNQSEFGNKWNKVVAELIRSNINGAQNENLQFDNVLLKALYDSMKVNIKNPSGLQVISYENSVTTLAKNYEKIKNNFIYTRSKNDIKPEYYKSLQEFESIYDSVGKVTTDDTTQIPLFSIKPIEIKDPKHFALKDKDIDYIDNHIVVTGGFKPSYDRLEIGNHLIFVFDIPFLTRNDIKYGISHDTYEDKNYLRIVGTRKLKYKTFEKDNSTLGGEFGIKEYPTDGLKVTSNPRKYGDFDFKIPIQSCYGRLAGEDFDNGMLTLKIEKTIFECNLTPDLN